MRPRFVVLLSLLATLGASAVPSLAGARPRRNHGLTIAVAPNPIITGEGVLIYGALEGSSSAGQSITLYHRIAGAPGYSVIGHATTDSHGFYEFTREEGVVETNRSWFVRGPDNTHSRTVFEHVAAAVDLSSSVSITDTRRPVTFTGSVSPAHPFQRVLLQAQGGNEGSGWHTVGSGRTGPASRFAIAHRWTRPGVYTVHAVFPGDRRNIAGTSDSLTVTVQQRQAPGFTINSSDPVIPEGGSVTISGVLDKAGSNVVEPSTSVTLYESGKGQPERALATAITDSSGAYRFAGLKPTQNERYVVRTTLAPHRQSAGLFEGVTDIVTLTATPTTVDTGSPVTFTGTVTPGKAGEPIYLQRLGSDGFWHDVGVHRIAGDGSYAFARVFAQQGARQFRTRIYADGYTVGSASPPVTITVSATVAALGALPPAS